MQLLTFQNAKTVKGEKENGVLTAILYLAPYNLSGVNLCPKASKGCAAACLYSAGRGAFQNVQDARMRKTKFFLNDRDGFVAQLVEEIGKAKRKAERKGLSLAVRLNGTSDIVWEKIAPEIFEKHSDVQFYDYTKIAKRIVNAGLPKNYYLLFSRSESNEHEALKVLKLGGNVAAVFDSMPKRYKGFPVIDGDKSDARFLERGGRIVGLKAKGKARKDSTGFVVRVS